MDYGRIIRRAFEIAWRYKTLWIFGLFAGGSSYFNFEFPSDRLGFDGFDRFDQNYDFDFLQDPEVLWPILGTLFLAIFVLGLIWLVIHCLSVPTIIDAVNKIQRGGIYQMGTSFSRGVDNFWRFLGLAILNFVAVIMTVLILILLSVVTFGIGLLIAIPAFIFALYFFFTIFELAKRVMVVRDCTIGDGLSEAYELFKRRFGDTVIMALIVLGLSIAIGIGMFVLWMMIGIPVGAMVWAMTESTVAGVVLGILVGLPISVVFGGYFGTFFTSLYTLFYFELVEPTRREERLAGPPPPPDMPGTAQPPPGTVGPDTPPPPPSGQPPSASPPSASPPSGSPAGSPPPPPEQTLPPAGGSPPVSPYAPPPPGMPPSPPASDEPKKDRPDESDPPDGKAPL